MRVHLTSSSFLLPGNPAWRSLAASHQVTFGEFGDWHRGFGELLSGNEPAAPLGVMVLFAGDLMPVEMLSQDGGEAFDALVASVLDAVDRTLASAGSVPVLIALSSHAALRVGPVERARRLDPIGNFTRTLEGEIRCRQRNHLGLYYLALDEILGAESFDARNFYAARCRLSFRGIDQLAHTVALFADRLARPRSKVLVLDCDNTLWGGVVGEVGVGGLVLGQDGEGKAFQDFQRAAKLLSGRGVLLAIVSKNNEQDAFEVFRTHREMVLALDDFVATKVNWDLKSQNIRLIADELGLGLDSFVFWDDNPVERGLVREALPQVRVVEMPPSVVEWPAFLSGLPEFIRFEASAEDSAKNVQYRARAKFNAARSGAADELDFLRGIALSPSLHEVDDASLARAAQLCEKTNQFNLRTVRYKGAEIQALAREEGSFVRLIRLRDRFGDHGIVGLVIARKSEGDECFLDSFMLSCRVLGRHLEAWVLAQVVAWARERGFRKLVAECIYTERNQVCREFLESHGAVVISEESDRKRYSVDPVGATIPYLEIFHG